MKWLGSFRWGEVWVVDGNSAAFVDTHVEEIH